MEIIHFRKPFIRIPRPQRFGNRPATGDVSMPNPWPPCNVRRECRGRDWNQASGKPPDNRWQDLLLRITCDQMNFQRIAFIVGGVICLGAGGLIYNQNRRLESLRHEETIWRERTK